MRNNDSIRKREDYLMSLGLFIPTPLNSLILLKQNERDIIDIIRHTSLNGWDYISLSSFSVSTGIGERTVQKTLKNLEDMGFISKGKTTSLGTHYKFVYKRFNNAIFELNKIKSPLERLIKADELRGAGFEIHKRLIDTLNNGLNVNSHENIEKHSGDCQKPLKK